MLIIQHHIDSDEQILAIKVIQMWYAKITNDDEAEFKIFFEFFRGIIEKQPDLIEWYKHVVQDHYAQQ